MIQLKSDETHRNLVAGLNSNEAAAQERSARATELTGQAQQAGADAQAIRKELELLAVRQHDLECERDRLERLQEQTQAEAESAQASALAALAQADDLRSILALVAPEALQNGQRPSETTGPQDVRLVPAGSAPGPFPPVQASPAPGADTPRNRKEKH